MFREHWEEAREGGRAESITVNFRSRGELLDAIDLAFERTWGESFEPLREGPGSREPAAPVEPCVDLLVVDKGRDAWRELTDAGDPFGEALHGAPAWRAAEARLLAKRVDELTRGGPWSYGDVVMLFRATTAMGLFERALEERGIPVHVVGGRGYWGQQQVADLRHWLAALANPLDGLALVSVLASPLAGLSLDAVALIGIHARQLAPGPVAGGARAWRGSARSAPGGGPAEAPRLRRAVHGRARRGRARCPWRRSSTAPSRSRATTATCSRCPAARAGWRTCAS